MKVLVQNLKSQLYLSPRGDWTDKVAQADDFIVTTLAYNVARQKTSGPFQVILHIHETQESITFMQGVGRAAVAGEA